MPPQRFNWNCAACALDWVLRATGLDENSTPEAATAAIGCPEQINPRVGLVDGSGVELRRVLGENYGQSTSQAWLDFDAVYELAQHTTGMMAGASWYHWVAIRGVSGRALWIANSAPNYRGISDTLGREAFQALGGFSVVWLES